MVDFRIMVDSKNKETLSRLVFGRRCFQLRRCGAVTNRTYRGHSPDFSSPGRRGFLTSPIWRVSLILRSTIIGHCKSAKALVRGVTARGAPMNRGVDWFMSRLVNSLFLCSAFGYISPRWGFRVFVYPFTIDMSPRWG